MCIGGSGGGDDFDVEIATAELLSDDADAADILVNESRPNDDDEERFLGQPRPVDHLES